MHLKKHIQNTLNLSERMVNYRKNSTTSQPRNYQLRNQRISSMRVIITFTKDSPYYQSGEQNRTVENVTEVHYSYSTFTSEKSTAFESDIDGTGFTVFNKWIEEFEVFYK